MFPELRGRCRSSAAPSALLTLLASCVSTELDPPSPELPCVSSSPDMTWQSSIAIVTVSDPPSFINCTGVLIAPTLMLTAGSCMFQPNAGAQPEDHGQLCDPRANWMPVERGDFYAWLDPARELSEITVTLLSDLDGPHVPVREVHRSAATSRCEDDLALLVLARGMTIAGARLRLDETTRAGDAVVLGSADQVGGRFVLSETPTSVAQVTDAAAATAPPRSVVLNGQVCHGERGGGIFSSDTGALIGITAWGSSGCDDPDGTTVGVRLAPFGRFLVEAAADAGDSLRAEASPVAHQNLIECEEP